MMIDLSCVVFTGWYVPYVRPICTSSLKTSAGSEFTCSAQRETPFWYSLAKGHWEVIACICVHHEQFSLLSVTKKDHCFLRLTRMGSNVAACSLQHLQTFLNNSLGSPLYSAWRANSLLLQLLCTHSMAPLSHESSSLWLVSFFLPRLNLIHTSQNHQVALLDKSCLSRGITRARKPVQV